MRGRTNLKQTKNCKPQETEEPQLPRFSFLRQTGVVPRRCQLCRRGAGGAGREHLRTGPDSDRRARNQPAAVTSPGPSNRCEDAGRDWAFRTGRDRVAVTSMRPGTIPLALLKSLSREVRWQSFVVTHLFLVVYEDFVKKVIDSRGDAYTFQMGHVTIRLRVRPGSTGGRSPRD